MKKRIISTLITAGLAFTAMTGVFQSVNVIASGENTISVEDITDWNTNGTELSLAMRDGSEMTAYKAEDVYSPERKQYIALDEITNVSVSGNAFQIVTADGNVYNFDQEGER